MDRKRRFASKPKTRDYHQSLFAPARREQARQIRDDSPAPQRPKWFSAVKSPYRGGAPSTVAQWMPASYIADSLIRLFNKKMYHHIAHLLTPVD
jgi:hypothetical protein